MKEITFQQQPTPNSCVSATLAMLLDKDVNDVIAEFHDKYMDKVVEIHDYLDDNNIEYRKCFTCQAQWEPGYIYKLCVPSLNILGGQHAILVDFRKDFKLYDPNMGREGVKYYVHKFEEDLLENEYLLNSFNFEYQILSMRD
jgi:hypothetical protein